LKPPRLSVIRTLVVIGTDCIGGYISIQLPYDHDGPNNSFGVDQKFKIGMRIKVAVSSMIDGGRKLVEVEEVEVPDFYTSGNIINIEI
jgi:hypothetical protein